MQNENSSAAGMQKYSGGISAKTVTASNLPIAVTSSPYNAVADCSTDSTAAIQAAINDGARSGQDVFLPPSSTGSCYKVSSLYFYHDPVTNPGYPAGAAGHSFHFYGVGPTVGDKPDALQRSSLVSTAINTPVLNIGDGKSFAFNHAMISDLTINANSSTWVIVANQVPNYSSFRRIWIDQAGSGGGFYLHNAWSNVLLEDVNVYQTGTTIHSGSAGVKVCNDVDGGLVTLNRVSANGTMKGSGWDHGFELGSVGGVDQCGRMITPLTMINVDAELDNTGIYIGRGPRGSLRDFYTERNHIQGVYLGNNNQGPWTIEAGYMWEPYVSNAGFYIDEPNAGRSYEMNAVHISGIFMNHINHTAVYINDTQKLTHGSISENVIAPNNPQSVAIGFPQSALDWIISRNATSSFQNAIPNQRYLAPTQ